MLKLFLYVIAFLVNDHTLREIIKDNTLSFDATGVEEYEVELPTDFSNSSCPYGFKLIKDGECRGVYANMFLPNNEVEEKGITRCKEIGGQPVIIHDEEHESYFMHQTPRDGHIPLGLMCNKSSKRWEWADGSVIDYRRPTNRDLDKECESGCMWEMMGDFVWQAICNSNYTNKFYIFCTKQLHQPVVPSGVSCDNFSEDSESGVCAQVLGTANNLQTSQKMCRSVGADLASIHSAQENTFIHQLAIENGTVSAVFLGASRADEGKSFEWMDGSKWDYDNFYPGFPQKGFGDCLVMEPFSAKGQWMNVDCSSLFPVACTRKKRALPAPECRTEAYQDAGVIFSPGFPYNASIPCEFFLKVDNGKKLTAEVVLLQANSCCDSLILYDGYIGENVIANLTGYIRNQTFTTTRTNFMRVSWQPKGGVNVRGMMMTFREV